ncbi:MAG: cyclase [Candidatus Pseudothioglobus sp.]|jgi:glyoxylase-like metal-dependent hydrolase (beta-lactamase superfamily II)
MVWVKRISLALVAIVIVFSGYVFMSVRSLEVESLSDDLHVLFGMGGNVAVLNTQEGTVIVDTMTFQLQGDRIKELAMKLTGKPVIAVINSHYHLDHTHGNPAFDPGVKVISTARTLHHLEKTDGEYFAEAPHTLPNETFSGIHRLEFGDKHLLLVSPGLGHTDGDLVVVFEEERVIHMGDLLFNGHYPNIDLEAGGSVKAWPATLDRTLELDFDRAIPGHGLVTDRAGVKQFQRFMVQLADIGRNSVDNGLDLRQTLKTAALTEDATYEEIKMIVPIGLDRSFVITRAWEEANGKITPRP